MLSTIYFAEEYHLEDYIMAYSFEYDGGDNISDILRLVICIFTNSVPDTYNGNIPFDIYLVSLNYILTICDILVKKKERYLTIFNRLYNKIMLIFLKKKASVYYRYIMQKQRMKP